MSIKKWAEKYRFKTQPYQKEALKMIEDDDIEKIVFKNAAQTTWTRAKLKARQRALMTAR